MGIPKAKPMAFHVMVKPRGAICNLGCEYCFYTSKEALYPEGTFRMSDATLEAFTKQYIEAQDVPEINFAWQGGEPLLMGLDFYKRAVELQKKYAPVGIRINNAIQTNGTFITDEWAKFFAEHRFLVGLSMDGPADIHDRYRKDKGGHGSHAQVLNAWKTLQKFKVETNIMCCVHAGNGDHGGKVYKFFRDELKADFLQFIPILEPIDEELTRFTHECHKSYDIIPQSVGSEQYGRFLISIFDEWVRHDVGKVFIQIFDITLGAWMGQPGGVCVFAKTCGSAMALEHNGDLYACDHYVFPQFFLGNIHQKPLKELVLLKAQEDFGKAKYSKLPTYCLDCKVKFACNGGCPKNRIATTPDGKEGRFNYLCPSYKAFFNHVAPYMQQMASLLRSRQPAARIMDLIR
jgi:uncharacterized protein